MIELCRRYWQDLLIELQKQWMVHTNIRRPVGMAKWGELKTLVWTMGNHTLSNSHVCWVKEWVRSSFGSPWGVWSPVQGVIWHHPAREGSCTVPTTHTYCMYITVTQGSSKERLLHTAAVDQSTVNSFDGICHNKWGVFTKNTARCLTYFAVQGVAGERGFPGLWQWTRDTGVADDGRGCVCMCMYACMCVRTYVRIYMYIRRKEWCGGKNKRGRRLKQRID